MFHLQLILYHFSEGLQDELENFAGQILPSDEDNTIIGLQYILRQYSNDSKIFMQSTKSNYYKKIKLLNLLIYNHYF